MAYSIYCRSASGLMIAGLLRVLTLAVLSHSRAANEPKHRSTRL